MRGARVRLAIAVLAAAVVGCSDGKKPPTAPPAVARVDVTPANTQVEVGGTRQLSAVPRDANGTALETPVTWSSANASVSVSTTGLVTAVAVGGPVIISASSGGKTGTATVTVVALSVDRIEVAPPTMTIDVGDTFQLSAIARDVQGGVVATPISWSSSNPANASVSTTGLVTGLATGPVTITASSGGKSGTCVFTIAPVAIASIAVTLTPGTVAVGQSAQALAVLRDVRGAVISGRSVSWTSSAPGVATVSASGRVTALTQGPARISATAEQRTAGADLIVAGAAADVRAQTINPMLQGLPSYITSEAAYNESLLPNNPGSATFIQAKVTMLRSPTLANDIVAQQRYAASSVLSRNGRTLPIVGLFPLDTMRAGAQAAVASLQLVLPILEAFYDLPLPALDIRLWYGFVIGNRGGGGSIFSEDQGTYEARTPATRLPFEAIVVHELGHTYMSSEPLNQFVELYAYNLVLTGSTSLQAWKETRKYVPFASTNAGVHAIFDIYQLIGEPAMARVYRALYALHPPYGVALSAQAQQTFVDQAPVAARAQVLQLAAKIQ